MKKLYLALVFALINFGVNADVLPLNDALRAAYLACVGIDEELNQYKTLAGINTAVSGVGTGLGAGATAVGIVKYSTDASAESYEAILNQLREKTKDVDYPEYSEEEIAVFENEFDASYESALKDIEKYEKELDSLNKKSKNLGNRRTGLLAGSTATNVASAVLAAKSGANGDISQMINLCVARIDDLNNSMLQAKMNGEDVSEANEIVSACREYKTVDASVISKRAKGAEVSSIVGATTGATGTIVSAVANSDKVRNDNSESGKEKEKNLNTTANVMAGATTVASAASTVFSATQIAAIKKIANVAAMCEGVLK